VNIEFDEQVLTQMTRPRRTDRRDARSERREERHSAPKIPGHHDPLRPIDQASLGKGRVQCRPPLDEQRDNIACGQSSENHPKIPGLERLHENTHLLDFAKV
jgi:hypothetical protein